MLKSAGEIWKCRWRWHWQPSKWYSLEGVERNCNSRSIENGQNQLFPICSKWIRPMRVTDKLVHQTAWNRCGLHTDWTIAHQTVYSIGHWLIQITWKTGYFCVSIDCEIIRVAQWQKHLQHLSIVKTVSILFVSSQIFFVVEQLCVCTESFTYFHRYEAWEEHE